MIHEELLIDAVKYAIAVSLPEASLTGIEKKIDEALNTYEDMNQVKLMLVDAYEVKQSFQRMRDKCHDIFTSEFADAIARSLQSVQEEFSSQLDNLEERLSSEILGDE